MEVEDLFVDLADGIKLLKLLEIISGEKLGKPNSGRMRVHKIENVNKSLAFLHTKVNELVYIYIFDCYYYYIFIIETYSPHTGICRDVFFFFFFKFFSYLLWQIQSVNNLHVNKEKIFNFIPFHRFVLNQSVPKILSTVIHV